MRLKVGDHIVLKDGKHGVITELRDKDMASGDYTVAITVTHHYWIRRDEIEKLAE